MKALPSLLTAALLVGAPLALTACERETRTEVEADGDYRSRTEVGVDDRVEEGAREAGQEIEEGARELGEDIERGAREAGDAIDRNVDLGDNAEDQ